MPAVDGHSSRLSRVAPPVAAALVVSSAYVALLWPMLADFSTYGFHDWDVATAYRYITTKSLLEYGEGPWWHPWLCGGVPAWGYVESATNLVSPYLPAYLGFDVRSAIRVEVIGGGLAGLLGAYLLAGRFTRSVALRALFCVLFVLNGRWALQIAVGHTWHLQYGLTPWAFYFFERAVSERRLRLAACSGASLAAMCFWGGIYPLPQTALLLSLYAALVAAFGRSLRPLIALLVAGVSSVGFAAPKLFAVLDHMQRVPRYIDSKEVIGLSELLVMLTDSTQRYGTRPVRVPAYNWHEWGIYVGLGGLLCLIVAIVFAAGIRGQALKICGLLCLLLGFGAFHEFAPWALLHELPVFSSQHVPSRFHYLMVFFLGLAFVHTASQAVHRVIERRPWADVLLLLPVAFIAYDLSRVGSVPFKQAFWMEAPREIPRYEPFEHRFRAIVQYQRPDWAAPMLLSMFANSGVVQCYGVDPAFVPGAIPKESPRYRGPAFLVEGPGQAEMVEWTPNRAVVRLRGARPGDTLAYNMNYDPSWKANGVPALEKDGIVAVTVRSANDTIEFAYFPRSFAYSLPLFVVTLGAVFSRASWLSGLRALTARGVSWAGARGRLRSASERAPGALHDPQRPPPPRGNDARAPAPSQFRPVGPKAPARKRRGRSSPG